MRVASIQIGINDHETKEQRIARVEQMLDKLTGFDLILLPEVWATGYFTFDNYTDEAEELSGTFTQRFSNKAKELSSYLFAGSFIEKKEGNYFNTSILFDREGKIAGTYKKIHLFRYGSQEGDILTAGQVPTVVETEFGKVGLSTCYDLRFPELFRAQIDLGAKIFLVTSAWPHQRLEHWKLLNSVRALENQCFLISCNCVGKTRNVLLGGHSQVVNPWGIVTSSAGEDETVLITEIHLDEVDRIREEFPQLKHRVL